MISILSYFCAMYTYNSSKTRSRSNQLISVDDIDTISLVLPYGTKLDEVEEILAQNTQYYSVISCDQSSNQPLSLVIRLRISDIQSIERLKASIFSKYTDSTFSFYNSPST